MSSGPGDPDLTLPNLDLRPTQTWRSRFDTCESGPGPGDPDSTKLRPAGLSAKSGSESNLDLDLRSRSEYVSNSDLEIQV